MIERGMLAEPACEPGEEGSPAEAREGEGARRCPIVGIGASAGGLEALTALFEHMPPHPGAAFVVISHLDPHRPSMMPELLDRVTPMPVRQAADGLALEPDHLYVIAPDTMLALSGGALKVTSPAHAGAIDTFFRSLAGEMGEDAVGVVLSGTGSDGTLGLKAIKERGGLTMVQAVESAKFDSMPRSAIAVGVVDCVLPVEELPARLADHLAGLGGERGPAGRAPEAEAEEKATAAELQRLCAILQRATGHDFSGYKPTTVLRRARRRAASLRLGSLAEYVARLEEAPAEADHLFRDLLIGVTQFFRDPEAFDALAREVVPRLAERAGGDPIRVWVPGCATGEEAFSIAMLIREGTPPDAPPPQIFGTDIDDVALQTARRATYPAAIAAHVSPERLGRFFVRQDDQYVVRKEIRDLCVFAVHNVITDPPFSRLDLISCRNVLIYMAADVQRAVLALFHYGLKEGGYLFVGPSEGAAVSPVLFAAVEQKSGILRRREAERAAAVPLGLPHRPQKAPAAAVREARPRRQDVASLLEGILLAHYTPPAVVVDPTGEIVFVSGRTGRYLELSPGTTNVNVVEMARGQVRADLRAALLAAKAQHEEHIRRGVMIQADGHAERVDIVVRPLPDFGGRTDLFLVVFRELGSALAAEQAGGAALEPQAGDVTWALERELRSTREHLQATISEREASNEALRSANEELQSTNEELQSANEELQTSKEELQSANEELQTVNAELTAKVDELDRANSYLRSLFASTRIPTIFLDPELRVTRFSPHATEVFRLMPGDVGRPITDITATVEGGDLAAAARRVLSTQIAAEDQVRRTDADVWYLRQIQPYRALDDAIEGLAITFVDVTELKRAQARAADLAAIVESSHEAIVGMTLGGGITSWNRGAEQLLGYPPGEAVGRTLELVLSPEALASLGPVYDRVRAGQVVEPPSPVRLRRKDGAGILVDLSVSPVLDGGGAPIGMSLIGRDVTERERVTQALVRSEERFRRISESGVLGIGFFDASGALQEANDALLRMLGYKRQELGAGIGWSALTPPDQRARIADELRAVGRLSPREVRFLRRDGTRFWALLAAALLGEGGEGVALTLDISEQKRAERAIDADRRKTEFLAVLAHELRNPLAPIRNALEILRHAAPGDAADQRAREIIDRQVMHMARLIDDLLDVSRITSGKILLRRKLVDVVSLARSAVEDHAAQAAAAGVALEAELPGEPLRVVGDPTRLSQSLGNLLSNALKFTGPDGSVRVIVERAPDSDAVVVRVRDTGIGMEPELLARAFEPFAQGQEDRERGNEGLGLGLPLVKALIELHGGTAEARSEGRGRGSEVVLQLPLAPAPSSPARAPAPGPNPAAPQASARRRVLVIEDSADAAESLRSLLELFGHEATTAESGAEGIGKATAERPDVILCDVHLPGGVDGYAVARALRADPATSSTYLIAMTGYGSDEDKRRSLEAGFDMHLTKPVDPEILQRVLDRSARGQARA
ncbi:MAG: PAS domain S-box protein [Polyangiaceae bacterium]|nr:PAS domain S-box protein [Polyangiaceae bacterium]